MGVFLARERASDRGVLRCPAESLLQPLYTPAACGGGGLQRDRGGLLERRGLPSVEFPCPCSLTACLRAGLLAAGLLPLRTMLLRWPTQRFKKAHKCAKRRLWRDKLAGPKSTLRLRLSRRSPSAAHTVFSHTGSTRVCVRVLLSRATLTPSTRRYGLIGWTYF